jgi:hypothetical protein
MLSTELAVIAHCTNKRQARRVRDTGSPAALVVRWRGDGLHREKWVRGVDEQRYGSPWHVTTMRGSVYCHDYLCSSPNLKAHIELADEYDVVHDRSDQPVYVSDAKL